MPPEPTFGGPDTAQRATVLAYARGISYETDLLLTDEQTLLLPGGARGPRARIEPARHAHRLTRAQLRQGAVIARFVSDGNYAPVGLSAGVQYFFVDSVASGWRGIIVHDDAARPVRVLRLVLTEPAHLFNSTAARWIEVGNFTILPNPRCGSVCCVPCDPMFCPPSGPNWPPGGPNWPPRLGPDGVFVPGGFPHG